MTDHDRLRRLAENATPGEWVAKQHETMTGKSVLGPREAGDLFRGPVVLMEPIFWDERSAANAEFIAAWNPETALNLLDELRDAKAKLQEAKAEGYERAVRDARQYALPSVGLVAIGMQNPYRETR